MTALGLDEGNGSRHPFSQLKAQTEQMLLFSTLVPTKQLGESDINTLHARIRALESENAALLGALSAVSAVHANQSAFEPRRLAATDDPVTCDPTRSMRRQLRVRSGDSSSALSCQCEGLPIGPGRAFTPPEWIKSMMNSLYDGHAPLDGVQVPLSRYRAKATLVVNVASA